MNIEIKKDSDRYLRLKNFPLACFLFANGLQIAGINETNNPREKEFVFVQSKRLSRLVDKYKFGDRSDPDLLVEVHLYEQARRELLDRLNDR